MDRVDPLGTQDMAVCALSAGSVGCGSFSPNDYYPPPPPSRPTSYYGGEGHFFLGGGWTSVTCTDECGEMQTFYYVKTCLGAAAGAGAGMGLVSSMGGTSCRSDTYEGWFFELGGCYGPACGGYDIGYTNTGGHSGVNEDGIGPGWGEQFKVTWCYYWLLQ